MNTKQTSNLKLIIGVALGLITAVAVNAMADGDPTTDTVPRMLPYQGTLENNGEPMHAVGSDAIAIRFSLFDGPDAEIPVYSQDLNIEVFAGRFTTTIGPVGTNAQGEDIPITEIIEAADDLHLGMTLIGNGETPDITLSNRQRILATPYAMWTTSATNLNVANNLNVGNDLNVGGTGRVGSGRPSPGAAQLRLGNNVAEDGAIDDFNDYQLLLNQGSTPESSYGLGVQAGTLFLNTNRHIKFYSQGQERLHMDNNILRTQNVDVTGNLTVGNNITGRLALRQVISEAYAQSGTYNLPCGANEAPISCGMEKTNNTAGDEDSIGCYVDLANNRCRVYIDVASSPDGTLRGHCMCLAHQ